VALDETTSLGDVADLITIFSLNEALPFMLDDIGGRVERAIPEHLSRTSAYLAHPVFHQHQSETEMLRYIKRLEARDLSLCHAMIPLGSCTMKLNATSEMMPVSWRGFNRIHPFAPRDRRRATRSSSASWSTSWPRSPASRRCRCSPTPVPRASTPA
jgi:glycine dehydrogenase